MKVLFVCTGNICRSPLAAALAARLGVDAASAGTSALDGAAATQEAQQVAAERGVDISAHRARLLRREDVDRADVIVAMGEGNRRAVEDLGGAAKVRVLDVPDPFGQGIDAYRAAADSIERALAR